MVTQDKIPADLDVKHLKKAPMINEGLKKVLVNIGVEYYGSVFVYMCMGLYFL